MNKKTMKITALACFMACVLVWVPNLVFQVASPLWLLTFLVAPVGIVLAAMLKHKWLIIGNTVMLFSFFWLMFGGYLVNSITNGQP
ncbi:hypothetical protein LCM20_16115 [Halobacillus litoralis]|uniref:hypothetical protein n=1 Tax=Halobacillus litoralis TaxID=45668 RepID=UPI001CD77B6A|nr:hypothetical protein [Halobacillus litoralis]MCA0972133.1 hypothetical protein [Halobacillus litoralis]